MYYRGKICLYHDIPYWDQHNLMYRKKYILYPTWYFWDRNFRPNCTIKYKVHSCNCRKYLYYHLLI